jgi:HAMP domain-containing protein
MSTSAPARREREPVSVSLMVVILIAMLVAGLLPVATISYNALRGYETASDQAANIAINLLDNKSLRVLQLRADQTATDVAAFLNERVKDTQAAVLIPRDQKNYLSFYTASNSLLWLNTGTVAEPVSQKIWAPLYLEMAFVGADGREQMRIREGKLVPDSQLRDVSRPENTTYLTEDYFAQAKALPEGEVYVSHVTSWHTSQPNQRGNDNSSSADNLKFVSYEAVIRFAAPVYTDGVLQGVVVLSLDHRHVMSFTLHILPTEDDSTAYADYASGNYAFAFDDEGYTISHPLLRRIRGMGTDGKVLPPGASSEQLKTQPFNMAASGWADANYPLIYDRVLKDEHGATQTVNQNGTVKVNTYAPIPFTYGVYKNSGYFGGVVIGAAVPEFHKAADQVRVSVATQREQFMRSVMIFTALGLVFLVAMAMLVSRRITRPLLQLTAASRKLEHGELDTATLEQLKRRFIHDEVSQLTRVFSKMADQVQLREQTLKQELRELHIQIDEQKKSQQVAEIVESEYFKNLRIQAASLRDRSGKKKTTEESQ